MFAEFYIEKKISEMPQQIPNYQACDCIKPKISEMPQQIPNYQACDCNKPKVIEKITDYKSLIKKKPAKKKIVNWNDYFEKSKKMFTTHTF